MAYYNEHSTTKNMKNHSDRFKHLKKITQILLPLSAFSLLFSHPSLSPLFVQSYDYLLSNFSTSSFKFKIFTCTTERNCIFLLCNGILVLIIQSSGLISKITPLKPKTARADDHDHHHQRDDENARFEESKKKGVEKVEILEEKIPENGGGDIAEVEEDLQSFVEVEKWDDEFDEDDDGGIDTEELEKKCEDFIKKVKLEIQGA